MNYPIFGRAAPLPRLEVPRPKRRDRELGSKWARAAAGWLRIHPFCAECRRHGRDVVAALVDHIVPRRHGGSMWDRANWQSLCRYCHDGMKRHLERLAVELGDVLILIAWMQRPELRPEPYAFVAISLDEA